MNQNELNEKQIELKRIYTFIRSSCANGNGIFYQKIGYTKVNKVYTFILIKDNAPRCINYELSKLFTIKRQKDTGCLIMDDSYLSGIKFNFVNKMKLSEDNNPYIMEII